MCFVVESTAAIDFDSEPGTMNLSQYAYMMCRSLYVVVSLYYYVGYAVVCRRDDSAKENQK